MGSVKRQKHVRDYTNAMFKWLGNKPHTKAMYINAFAAVVMAVAACLMCWSLLQNRGTIQLAGESLEMARKDFQLRNRPWVNVYRIEFGGPGQDLAGKVYQQTVCIGLQDMSDIPARLSRIVHRAVLNGDVVAKTDVEPICLAKGMGAVQKIFLTEDQYQAARRQDSRFEIHVEVTYSGMLEEKPDTFSTTATACYSPTESRFKFTEVNYQ